MDESRAQRKKRFARVMIREVRENAGLSRNALALELYVSPKTIQNWEDCVSVPDAEQLLELHKICGQNLETNFKKFLYNDNREKSIRTKERLITIIENELTGTELENLLFLLDGEHGASRYCYLQKIVADLHTSLARRHATSVMIENNFVASQLSNTLTCENEIMPDIQALKEANNSALNSLSNGLSGYQNINEVVDYGTRKTREEL